MTWVGSKCHLHGAILMLALRSAYAVSPSPVHPPQRRARRGEHVLSWLNLWMVLHCLLPTVWHTIDRKKTQVEFACWRFPFTILLGLREGGERERDFWLITIKVGYFPYACWTSLCENFLYVPLIYFSDVVGMLFFFGFHTYCLNSFW